MAPTVDEIDFLKWKDPPSNDIEEVSIMKKCVENQLAEKIKEKLKLPDELIHARVREIPLLYCRSVFQVWLIYGSSPPNAYPKTWSVLMNVLNDIGLDGLVKQIKNKAVIGS